MADLAKKLNTKEVHPSYLQALVAGRLIPLDKNPGVRPIGIGEVLRRIISSATMSLLKPELVNATAPLQTCAGLSGGIEASIHAMRKIYEDEETEGILLIDAANAFNALNRKAALHNVQFTCPELSNFVRNIYSTEAELFLPNTDKVIYSREGTTQGGPESMGFYAVSTTLLSNPYRDDKAKKIFYADDGSGGGKLADLRNWWDDLKMNGPLFGYYPEATKTWLITKPMYEDKARQMFPDVNVTIEGRKFLGSFIGTKEATCDFIIGKIEEWEKYIIALAKIAEYEPQLAYSAYIYGTSRRWQFVSRTTPGISESMKSLENLIRNKLMPTILGGRDINDEMRLILNLPARMGGMGFLNPSDEADQEYQNSVEATAKLTDAIYNQHPKFVVNEEEHVKIVDGIRKRKDDRWKDLQQQSLNIASDHMKRILLLASEKGASTWLTSIPMKMYGFRLSKQQFWDALCMRYDLCLKDVPKYCQCGQLYSINHSLTCKKGGFVIIRHNVVRDTIGEILQEVCKDVRIEPQLLPVTGEELPARANTADGARADVSAIGLWQPLNRAFLDIKVFNPLASSNATQDLQQVYRRHEQEKKAQYNDRVMEIEKGTFTPVIFSCSGGASKEANRLLKAIAQKLAEKRSEAYSTSISFIRRRISFDLVRTCVISFRGDRGCKRDLAIEELDYGIKEMEVY